MKKVLSVIILMLILSCKKKEFDLAELKFPIEKQQLSSLGVNTEEYSNYINGNILTFDSEKDTVMVFGGLKLAGNISRYNTKDMGYDAANYIAFFQDPTKKNIQAYEISIRTIEETELLEKYFDEKFGKTDFHYRDKETSCRIWEKDNNLYFLGIDNDSYNEEFMAKHLKSALLFVVDKSSKMIIKEKSPQGSYFQFYEYYLEAKEEPRNKNKKFTYRDFIERAREENEFKDVVDVIYFQNYVKE